MSNSIENPPILVFRDATGVEKYVSAGDILGFHYYCGNTVINCGGFSVLVTERAQDIANQLDVLGFPTYRLRRWEIWGDSITDTFNMLKTKVCAGNCDIYYRPEGLKKELGEYDHAGTGILSGTVVSNLSRMRRFANGKKATGLMATAGELFSSIAERVARGRRPTHFAVQTSQPA